MIFSDMTFLADDFILEPVELMILFGADTLTAAYLSADLVTAAYF